MADPRKEFIKAAKAGDLATLRVLLASGRRAQCRRVDSVALRDMERAS